MHDVTTAMDKLRDALRKNAPHPDQSPAELRANMDAASKTMPVPEEVAIEATTIAGIAAEVHTPPGDTAGRTILYLHGGGYVMGSLLSVRNLAANVALASGAKVLALDYRLAPEHPCPAGIDDAVAAYDALLEAGHDPAKTLIGGDSAGGGLTLATLLTIRDSGRPLPAGGIGISPWLDMELRGASFETNAELDPMINLELLATMRDHYAGGLPYDDPRVSPAKGELAGLPPLLMQVGDAECLRDDVVEFAQLATAAGVDVTLDVAPDMIHVWHMFAPRLPAANEALEKLGAWTAQRW